MAKQVSTHGGGGSSPCGGRHRCQRSGSALGSHLSGVDPAEPRRLRIAEFAGVGPGRRDPRARRARHSAVAPGVARSRAGSAFAARSRGCSRFRSAPHAVVPVRHLIAAANGIGLGRTEHRTRFANASGVRASDLLAGPELRALAGVDARAFRCRRPRCHRSSPLDPACPPEPPPPLVAPLLPAETPPVPALPRQHRRRRPAPGRRPHDHVLCLAREEQREAGKRQRRGSLHGRPPALAPELGPASE